MADSEEEGVVDFSAVGGEIVVGPLARGEFRHLIQGLTTETSVAMKQKDGDKPAKSTKTLQITVHKDDILWDGDEGGIYPEALRMAGAEFGVDTVKNRLRTPFSGLVFSCCDDSNSRFLAALIEAEVEGVAPGSHKLIQVDGHEVDTALSSMKMGVALRIVKDKIHFEFESIYEDGDAEGAFDDILSESTSLRLYDNEELTFGPMLLSGCLTGSTPLGPPLLFVGPLFFTFLHRHVTGGSASDAKVFEMLFYMGAGTGIFVMDTKINEIQSRQNFIEADAKLSDKHVVFGKPRGGGGMLLDVSDPDAFDSLFDAPDAAPRPRKRKRVEYHERVEGLKQVWNRSMDLSKIFRAFNPVQEKIACVWVIPCDGIFVFIAPMQDRSLLTVSLGCREE